MGRKQKYKNIEEKKQANRDKFMRFYWRNADKIRKINLNRYHEKINNK